MKDQKYSKDVATLQLDTLTCTGCGMCTIVCPHKVFKIKEKAEIINKDACMECGACARNCPVNAISVRSGVGCAYGILLGKLMRKMPYWLSSEKMSCCGKNSEEETGSCCTGSEDSDKTVCG